MYCPSCGSWMEEGEKLGKWEWLEWCPRCGRAWVVCQDNQDLTVTLEEVEG